jgi:hypothetical protein
MDLLAGILMIWITPAVIAVVISAPIVYLSRNRVDWHPAYLIAFVVPFVLWLLAPLLFPSHGKSMTNFAVEVGAITLSLPIILLFRAILGRSISKRLGVVGVIGMTCAVALVVYFAVPPLPE